MPNFNPKGSLVNGSDCGSQDPSTHTHTHTEQSSALPAHPTLSLDFAAQQDTSRLLRLTSPSAPSHNIHALAHTTTYTHVVPEDLGSHSSKAIEALGANANPDNENNGKGGTVVGFAEGIKNNNHSSGPG